MWKTPTHRGRWRFYGRAGGTLPASDPPPRPYSPPSEGTANKPGGCAIDTSVQKPPHHLAVPAGWILLPVLLRYRFVSFGPRYPLGRILQCDASASLEVVLPFYKRNSFASGPVVAAVAGSPDFARGRSKQVSLIFFGIAPCVDGLSVG